MNLRTNFTEEYENYSSIPYEEEYYEDAYKNIKTDDVSFKSIQNMLNIFELEDRNKYVLVAYGVTFFYFILIGFYLFYHFVLKKKICARYKAKTPKMR
jgi:hypothetical protein